MDNLQAYLFAGAVLAIVIGWSVYFHVWSNSPAARRARNPVSLAISATALSALFLVAGIAGLKLNHTRFSPGSAWTDAVIWWQVGIGLALAPLALHLVRKGARDVDRRLGLGRRVHSADNGGHSVNSRVH